MNVGKSYLKNMPVQKITFGEICHAIPTANFIENCKHEK